jgi:TctA family transporter
MEENLRRSMLLSDGDPSVFFTRPISGSFMVATVVLLLLFILPAFRKKRVEVIVEEGPAR